jgi:hypothetical protein
MLVVYQTTQEDLCDRQSGEESEIVTRSETAPTLGDELTMNGDRLWQVVHTEAYQADDSLIHLAFVVPCTEERELEWNSLLKQEYPKLSFYVLVDGSEIMTYGWRMDGSAPTGQIMRYEPAGEDEPMQEVASEWEIDRVISHHPTIADPAYSAIHVCQCKSLLVAA